MAITLQGNNWGSLLGTGLAQGIEGVTNQKIQELQRRNQQERTAKGLGVLPNMPPEIAQQLSMLDPQTLGQVLKGMQQQQLAQQEASLFNALEGLGGQQPQTPGTGVQGSLQATSLGRGQAIPLSNSLEKKRQNKINNDMANENLKLKKKIQEENQASKEQARIDKHYKKEVDSIREAAPLAQNRFNDANKAKQLLNSGKFGTGIFAGRTSQLWSDYIKGNPDLEEYDRLLNQFVVDSLGDLSGVSTEQKDKRIEAAKTKITKTKEAQEEFWNNVIKKQETPLYKSFALEDLIDENEGNLPKKLDSRLAKRAYAYQTIPASVRNLGPVKEKTVVEDGGKLYIFKSGRWSPLGKGL